MDVCGTKDADNVKKEIYKYGPVIAGIVVHNDFLTYKSGIYHPDYALYQYGGHQIVEVVGWGKNLTTNIEYWVIKNSMGEDWGENGFANVVMGDEDLGISSIILAPLYNVPAKPEGGVPSDAAADKAPSTGEGEENVEDNEAVKETKENQTESNEEVPNVDL